jgi:hypothetical protein
VAASGVGWGAVPTKINIQGKISQSGAAVSGGTVIFRYATATGSPINAENTDVGLNGIFNSQLNFGTDTNNFPSNYTVYICYKPTTGGEVPIGPQELLSVPYAFKAAAISGQERLRTDDFTFNPTNMGLRLWASNCYWDSASAQFKSIAAGPISVFGLYDYFGLSPQSSEYKWSFASATSANQTLTAGLDQKMTLTSAGNLWVAGNVSGGGNLSIYNVTANSLAASASISTPSLILGGVARSTWPSGWGGSGTSGYLTKVNATTDLANSAIYDKGGFVGIGTINPATKLNVIGTASFENSSSNSVGIYSVATGSAGIGVYAKATDVSGIAIKGLILNAGNGPAIVGQNVPAEVAQGNLDSQGRTAILGLTKFNSQGTLATGVQGDARTNGALGTYQGLLGRAINETASFNGVLYGMRAAVETDGSGTYTGSPTGYGISSSVNPNFGATGSKYGLAANVSGTAATNYGLYTYVSGATNNYGGYFVSSGGNATGIYANGSYTGGRFDSTSGAGIYSKGAAAGGSFESTSGPGVIGKSTNGTGIYGTGTVGVVGEKVVGSYSVIGSLARGVTPPGWTGGVYAGLVASANYPNGMGVYGESIQASGYSGYFTGGQGMYVDKAKIGSDGVPIKTWFGEKDSSAGGDYSVPNCTKLLSVMASVQLASGYWVPCDRSPYYSCNWKDDGSIKVTVQSWSSYPKTRVFAIYQ